MSLKLFTQVYETLLFNIYLKKVINKRYGQKWDINMWGYTDVQHLSSFKYFARVYIEKNICVHPENGC